MARALKMTGFGFNRIVRIFERQQTSGTSHSQRFFKIFANALRSVKQGIPGTPPKNVYLTSTQSLDASRFLAAVAKVILTWNTMQCIGLCKVATEEVKDML